MKLKCGGATRKVTLTNGTRWALGILATVSTLAIAGGFKFLRGDHESDIAVVRSVQAADKDDIDDNTKRSVETKAVVAGIREDVTEIKGDVKTLLDLELNRPPG